jgi:hypothetical protein
MPIAITKTTASRAALDIFITRLEKLMGFLHSKGFLPNSNTQTQAIAQDVSPSIEKAATPARSPGFISRS